jgi:hypothetical protein
MVEVSRVLDPDMFKKIIRYFANFELSDLAINLDLATLSPIHMIMNTVLGFEEISHFLRHAQR